MCSDGAGPGFVADKVGVEGADGKVIDAFVGAGVVQLSDRHPPTIVADQQVAGSQLACRHPATPIYIKRMLRRGADDLSGGQVQVPDTSHVLEPRLNLANQHRRIRLPFQSREDFVADLERFNRFRPVRRQQLRPRRKTRPQC
jgi:hypothetical protein